jgi:hypothetical protein
MRSPVPYGKQSLNNSPLVGDGSDFPCKLRPGVYDQQGAQNIMVIGENQTLSFIGSAVHGGGSCQVALTTDLQPTRNSRWMVIKSIEGGCPANVPGNLPEDPNGAGASTFQFAVPEGIAPGDYTIAWAWLNKIGNREFYMNCGPATIVASRTRKRHATLKLDSFRRQTSFPDLFVANLESINSCRTQEGFDYLYPDPGAEVEQRGVGPYTQLSCDFRSNTVSSESSGIFSASVASMTNASTSSNGTLGASRFSFTSRTFPISGPVSTIPFGNTTSMFEVTGLNSNIATGATEGSTTRTGSRNLSSSNEFTLISTSSSVACP